MNCPGMFLCTYIRACKAWQSQVRLEVPTTFLTPDNHGERLQDLESHVVVVLTSRMIPRGGCLWQRTLPACRSKLLASKTNQRCGACARTSAHLFLVYNAVDCGALETPLHIYDSEIYCYLLPWQQEPHFASAAQESERNSRRHRVTQAMGGCQSCRSQLSETLDCLGNCIDTTVLLGPEQDPP